MKQVLVSLILFVLHEIYAQSSYVIPNQFSTHSYCTIYIDIEKACDSTQFSSRLDTYLKADSSRLNDVYIWLWSPTVPIIFGGNGSWVESNPQLKMTHVSGFLFSYTLTISEFFDVFAQNFDGSKISCLAKTKDGSAQTKDQTIFSWNVSVDPAPSEAIQLYPIPAREQITIVHPTPGMAFEIVDLSGRQVFSEKNPFQAETTIDTHTWQPGMYLLSYPGTGQKRHFVVE